MYKKKGKSSASTKANQNYQIRGQIKVEAKQQQQDSLRYKYLINSDIINSIGTSNFYKHPSLAAGFYIHKISLLNFPKQDDSGEYFDYDDDNPDVYFELADSQEETLGVSEVMHQAIPKTNIQYTGMDMPFRIVKGKNYKLILKDYDPSGINPDDKMSSYMHLDFNKLMNAGYPNSIEMNCPNTPTVRFKVHVNYEWSKNNIEGKAKYLTRVKPITQEYIRNGPPPVLEGCGPIAAAMVLTYWHDVKGYDIMNSKDANFRNQHPKHTIAEFYDTAPARQAPVESNGRKLSYTLKMNMKDGLQDFCDNANRTRGLKPELDAQIDRRVRAESYKMTDLKEALLREEPVIIMLVGIPPGLNSLKDELAWRSGRHYTVAVGFDDTKEEIYLLSGWKEKDIDFSKGPNSHSRKDNCLPIITYKEFDEADPSLLWIRQIDGSK